MGHPSPVLCGVVALPNYCEAPGLWRGNQDRGHSAFRHLEGVPIS